MNNKNLVIEVVSGAEGSCLCISKKGSSCGKRVAGPKPWGGGGTTHKFLVNSKDLIKDIEEVS